MMPVALPLLVLLGSLAADDGQVQYVNPKADEAAFVFLVNGEIPKEATAKAWVPIPREWENQRGVKIRSIKPTPTSKGTEPRHRFAYGFWQFAKGSPARTRRIELRFSFTCYEVNATVEPKRLPPFDRTKDLYPLYTKTEPHIELTEEVKKLARSIVGSQENPYLQARALYDWILDHMTYGWRKGYGLKYAMEEMRGDCGQHGVMFIGLCRALGIPARGVYGFMAFPPGPESREFMPHGWAEFYVPGHGWLPCDPAVGRNPGKARHTSKPDLSLRDYYFGNLDNQRLIFSKGNNPNLSPRTADKPEPFIQVGAVRYVPEPERSPKLHFDLVIGPRQEDVSQLLSDPKRESTSARIYRFIEMLRPADSAAALRRKHPELFREAKGVVVVMVLPGSQAERAGLKTGDIILKYNGASLNGVQDVERHSVSEEQKRFGLVILRGEQKIRIQVHGGKLGVGLSDF